MKRVGGPSVPVVGAGAIRLGPPPSPPRNAPSPWSTPGPAARRGQRRSRWPGFLLMLAGIGGLVAVDAALRDGAGLGWSKAAFIDIAAWVAARPGWAPGVAAELAVLTRPTLLWLVGGVAAIGALARGGFGKRLLLTGLGLLLIAFAAQAFGLPDWLPVPRSPAAPAFWAVLVWAWLFTVLGGGVMPLLGVGVGALAAAGRVAVGDAAPIDALAGACAAVAFWGAVNWATPARRNGAGA